MNDLAAAVAIVGLLAYTFSLLMRLLEIVLRSPRQIPTIAKGLLVEASRTRLSLAFISFLLLILLQVLLNNLV